MKFNIKILLFLTTLTFIGHTDEKEDYQRNLNAHRDYFEKSDVNYLIQGASLPEGISTKRNYTLQLSQVINKLFILTNLKSNKFKRIRVLESIGVRAPHPDFLPLLRIIISSNHEPLVIRKKAMRVLVQIPHNNMINDILKSMLIKELHSTSRLIFIQLTNISLSFVPKEDSFEVAAKQIIDYWNKNKGKIEIPTYNRIKMLNIY